MSSHESFKFGAKVSELLIFLVLLIHWVGCAWYIMIERQDSWIPPKDLNEGVTIFYEETVMERYVDCLYYALLMLWANEMAPISNTQTFFSILVFVIGSIFTAFIFGSIAAMVSHMQRKRNIREEFQDIIRFEMKKIKLPEKLQD